MKSFLIIGLGTFAHHLCYELSKTKCDIVIADHDADAMEDLLPLVISAKVCDCTKSEVLKTFDIPSFDVCFVCINKDFQACLEITDLLKELGAKKIFSKADRLIEAKFLLRCGADNVIYPERDAAARIAASVSYNSIFDCIDLSGECSIFEVKPHADWIGKTIADLDLRSKYQLNIIAAKKDSDLHPILDPNYVFNEDEHIFVIGKPTDLKKVFR